MGFREQGYLPEAMTNFLALLGWNPGTEQELFTREELINEFTIERINKSGAKFDIEKAKWFNQQYLKNVDNNVLAVDFLLKLQNEGIECSKETAADICGLLKERVTFPSQFWSDGQYFFFPPTTYDEKIISKKWNEEVRVVLIGYKEALKNEDTLTRESSLEILSGVLEERGVGLGKIMQVLRVVITGVGGGPDLMGIIAVVGRDEVIARIDLALQKNQ